MTGRVVAVVGPSGVGKDSVMEAVAVADTRWQIVRRTITRAPGLGGEDYDPVTEAEFAEQAQAGAFCLHWAAHDLHYGIPTKIQTEARSGALFLVNLSRAVLTQAAEVFPDFAVLNLTASPEVLAARLAGRGRETVDDIARRLARSGAQIPDTLTRYDIANDGPLDDTVAAVLKMISPHEAML